MLSIKDFFFSEVMCCISDRLQLYQKRGDVLAANRDKLFYAEKGCCPEILTDAR